MLNGAVMTSRKERPVRSRDERLSAMRILPGIQSEQDRRGANHTRYSDGEEPPLAELLNDPLTHRLMASDGVKEKHLMLVIAEAQARLNGA